MPASDLFSSLNLMTSFVFRFFKMWSDHLLPSSSHTSTTVHVSPVPTSPSGSSVIPSRDYLLANKIMWRHWLQSQWLVVKVVELKFRTDYFDYLLCASLH